MLPPLHVVEANRFYDASYDLLCYHVLRPGHPIVLGPDANRVCRFCRRTEPIVSFKRKAHAIPEALGNKSLFTNWECDTCNHHFGTGIENDLGAYTKPDRTFGRIPGKKKKVPSLKQHGSTDYPWRVDVDRASFRISDYEHDPMIDIVRERNQIRLVVTRDAYTPLAVIKAFVRIGLTLIPPNELPHFPDALRWIMDSDHTGPGPRRIPATLTFQPGPMPNDVTVAAVLRRKQVVSNVPYAFVVLAYGNVQYQVCMPSAAKDSQLMGAPLDMPSLKMTTFVLDRAVHGQPHTAPLDLFSTGPVRGERVPVSIHFDSIARVRPQPNQ